MASGALLLGTSGAVGWSLWTRRSTCRQPDKWHIGATYLVIFGGLCLIMIAPYSAPIFSTALHSFTGRWGVNVWVGQVFGICAVQAGIHNSVIRIEESDEVFWRKFAIRVQLPVRVTTPILFALFWMSQTPRAAQRLSMFDTAGDTWLRAYWVTLCALYLYLLGYGARAWLTLRHDPDSRTTALIYFWGTVTGMVAAVARIAMALGIGSAGHPLLWGTTCGSICAGAVGAGYSWRRRKALA